jgi:hypothetical protein
MTCRQAQKSLMDLFDAEISPSASELRAHVDACEHCARAYDETRAALAVIEPPFRVQASPDFKERVMNEIAKIPTPAGGRRFLIPKLAFAVAGAVALVVLAPLLGSLAGRKGHNGGAALQLLAQSAAAMANLDSVHITARVRTWPQENFEHIDPARDWQPLEIWKQFGQMPRWRVEKPGRVAAMDGISSVLWIKPDQAVRGGPRSGFLDWLAIVLDTDQLMRNELEAAKANSFAATVAEEKIKGVPAQVLRVKYTRRGVLSNDWLRNKNVSNSDHTRIYRFEPATKRLEAMQIVLHTGGADVPVFEITSIRYNEALDPALFTLTLPANVIWHVPPEQMPTASRPLPQSPKETAEVFFDAMSREDWELAATVYPATSIPDKLKQYVGGLKVVSIGEPFQSGLYRGWFVPYEIKLKSGYVKKHNLAVRNDNAAKRWVFDGGI